MIMIPCYGPDGRRVRDFSLEAVLRLETVSMAVVRRNRKKVVTRAHFRASDGGHPLAGIVRLGQRYSFQAKSEGLRWWEFAEFLSERDAELVDRGEIDVFLVSVFRAVPLSCLKPADPPPAAPAAKPARRQVTSIDAVPRRQRQPLEQPAKRAA